MPTITKFSRSKRPTKKFGGMKTAFNYHSSEWRKLRQLKFNSAFGVCEKCGGIGHTVDHIKPINQGGAAFDMDNLQLLCKSCNGRKTALDSKNAKEGGY